MPIFEYNCRGCGHQFETLLLHGATAVCPNCTSVDLEKLLSVPAVKSQSTHANALKAAKKRDKKQGEERVRAQREYELHHND